MANPFDSSSTTTTKRRKTADQSHAKPPQPPPQEEKPPLIHGLPDHIAQISLSSIHPSLLSSVCHSWRQLIYSSSFPPFPSLYALLTPSQTDQNNLPPIQFSSFDPISSTWHALPPPPSDPPLRFLLRHPSFLSRYLPIQSVAVSGNLVLLAGTSHQFLPALPRPLIFNPELKSWFFGPPLSSPRRWCAVGCSNNTVYVASGIGSQYSSDVAKSVEKWDFKKYNNNNSKKKLFSQSYLSEFKSSQVHDDSYEMQNVTCIVARNSTTRDCWKEDIEGWEKMGMLKDGRLSRDAIEAIGYKGKLYMVNVKGNCAKEGVVYDIERDVWEEMKEGMVAGWRGPAASMDEDIIYVVDETRGALMKYDPERDAWEEAIEDERLKGAEQIAAGRGRVCVVRNCGGIVVVDVLASPPRIWEVETPVGLRAVAVHILPRMNQW